MKYCGMERPRKNEEPSTNLVLKLLRLQNWRKPRPAEAAYPKLQTLVKFMTSKALQRLLVRENLQT